MRIGIDARFYGPIKQKGLGRYVQKLVEGLEKVCHCEEAEGRRSNLADSRMRLLCRCAPRNDKKEAVPCHDIEFVIFLRKENWDEYQPKSPNFKKVLADYRWYGLAEQIFFPWKIRQAKVDLMHFPHFNAPLFCGRPFIVTIHDLILKKYPTNRASKLGPVRYFIKNLGYNFIIKSVVKRAKKIIAVSEYTKKDILRYFRVEPEKIRVIYEGAPQLPRDSSSASVDWRRRTQNNRLDSRFRGNDTKGRYLLYVGNAYPHKNLERLVLAFQELNQDYPDLKLVLVGELDYFYRRLKAAVPAAIKEKIIFTDFVSDERLAELYRNAELYVFPSLCEGFGLPPLEAMAFGLPVVCSNGSCLPEILGEAALYFCPENVKEMAEKIKSVLENKEVRKELRKKGYQKIKEYSWPKMTEQTLEEYKNCR